MAELYRQNINNNMKSIFFKKNRVLKNKNPNAECIGIVLDVGHTGFEPVTSTLSR